MQDKKAYFHILFMTASILSVVVANGAYGQIPGSANKSDLLGTVNDLINNASNSIEPLDDLSLVKLYESDQTIVLRGEGPDFGSLGKASDQAKMKGFRIDSVTVFTETSRAYVNTRYLTDIYTVFMSKNR